MEVQLKKRRTDYKEESGNDVDDQWVEKGGPAQLKSQEVARISPTAPISPTVVTRDRLRDEDDDAEVGPQLPVEIQDRVSRAA